MEIFGLLSFILRLIDKKGEQQKNMLYRIDSIQKVKIVDEDKI